MRTDEEFMKHLKATFRIEAEEHLNNILLALVALEKKTCIQASDEEIENIFRETHSLKGASRAVNLRAFEEICQLIEPIFRAVKNGEIIFGPEMFNLLHESADYLKNKLNQLDEQEHESEIEALLELKIRLNQLIDQKTIKKEATHEVIRSTETVKKKDVVLKTNPKIDSDNIRVSTVRLNSVLLQAEELITTKLATSIRLKEMKEISKSFDEWKREWDKVGSVYEKSMNNPKRKETSRKEVDTFMKFMAWHHDYFVNFKADFERTLKRTESDKITLERMVDNLLVDMKKMTMVPFASTLELIPKIVRDLSHDVQKEVDVEIKGSEIEIDRRILEQLKDPIIHIIRNCMDHGIERPELRLQRGKNKKGQITIQITPLDHKVELIISDDGNGIETEKIRHEIGKQKLLPASKLQNISDKALLNYVFNSGISTSDEVSKISGRGLGLAIVKEKIEKIGGNIEIESKLQKGTQIRMWLPLTIAMISGVLIMVRQQKFIIPALFVERVIRIRQDQVKNVENRQTILFRDRPVVLVALANILEIESDEVQKSDYLFVVVLKVAEMQLAFLVDQIEGEQDVLFKNLGPQLSRVKNISGATILGNGKAIPILNVPDLFKSAGQTSNAWNRLKPIGTTSLSDAKIENFNDSILVVEDSITTRSLLKNILQTAGYAVDTAIDGIDALKKLNRQSYMLVLSDVDMPKMNGFELTQSIRNNEKLKEIPIILLTELSSDQDREKGLDAGANAYLVKSMFEQNNFLNEIQRIMPGDSAL